MHARDCAMALLLLASGLGLSGSALAGDPAQPPAAKLTLAESLFQQGQQLMAETRYAEACPKLAESHRLDPAGGTLLNLAVCHENEGRTATAWAEYREALVAAVRDRRPEREALARTRLEALEPLVPRVQIIVSWQPPRGGIVRLDGVEVGAAGWGTSLPLDPGPHEISAEAPGRKRFSLPFTLQPGDKRDLAVPELEPETVRGARPNPARAREDDTARDPGEGRRTAGFVAGGIGLVAVGVGSWFGLQAVLDRKNSDAKCNPVCTDEAVALNDDAKRNARLSNIGFGVGLVGLGAGAYLVLSSPYPTKPARRSQTGNDASWQLRASCNSNGAGVAVDGRW